MLVQRAVVQRFLIFTVARQRRSPSLGNSVAQRAGQTEPAMSMTAWRQCVVQTRERRRAVQPPDLASHQHRQPAQHLHLAVRGNEDTFIDGYVKFPKKNSSQSSTQKYKLVWSRCLKCSLLGALSGNCLILASWDTSWVVCHFFSPTLQHHAGVGVAAILPPDTHETITAASLKSHELSCTRFLSWQL